MGCFVAHRASLFKASKAATPISFRATAMSKCFLDEDNLASTVTINMEIDVSSRIIPKAKFGVDASLKSKEMI